jgi:hypothetical protein
MTAKCGNPAKYLQCYESKDRNVRKYWKRIEVPAHHGSIKSSGKSDEDKVYKEQSVERKAIFDHFYIATWFTFVQSNWRSKL